MAHGASPTLSVCSTAAVPRKYGAKDFVSKLYAMMKQFYTDGAAVSTKLSGDTVRSRNDHCNAGETHTREGDVETRRVHNAGKVGMTSSCSAKCIGLPLPAAEPPNASTGRRLVHFEEKEHPVSVKAEKRSRYLCVVLWPSNLNKGEVPYQPRDVAECSEWGVYGTVLGYTDDDTGLIWHKRGDLFASCLPLSAISVAMCVPAVRCRHCAHVVPRTEVIPHVGIHQLGLGKETGAFVDDETWGTACGDTHLLQHLQRMGVVGSGGQGDVVLCRVRDSKEEARYVVKVMQFSSMEAATSVYHRAVRYMLLQHERLDTHLVEYLAVRLLPGGTTAEIVMPYYAGGDLATAIRELNVDRFEELYICSLILQILKALVFLHEHQPPVVHGDLKAENILLSDEGREAVLTDFDSYRELNAYEKSIRAGMGTIAWMAPEVRHKRQLMSASDLWGVGLLMYVLAVLPDYPMITDPNTGVSELMNATVWRAYDVGSDSHEASTTDGHATAEIFDILDNSTIHESRINQKVTTGYVTLTECVRKNVRRRGYSDAFVDLTTRLLSYHPGKRPRARGAVEELAKVIQNHHT
ncbi:protein kinase, putative [Trypanosoma equiperdum]|uniref:Protein kinase, putative n=2 Tax=Trypanozoon TaxID=39700 RepID=Q57X32_TRYB2|nr:protein kinase, putative [Trypanosoma brucei brucei TREU927]AAX69837.1 protein kinase, putative [Trypanosoma brucei]AAZ13314.1 protein kinase, putative [Trypanosoma brucei brucei TREU927]SCU67187.1 protein kinase, putative [Trypanosoma equiperdum]